jgi:hypothetical protein
MVMMTPLNYCENFVVNPSMPADDTRNLTLEPSFLTATTGATSGAV